MSRFLASAWFIASVVAGLAPACADEPAATTAEPVDLEFFEKKVRPLLVERCFECHGPDSGDGEGGLRLDTFERLERGGDSGAALVAGKPEQSLLILAVQHDPSLAPMPPKSKLKADEIQTLVQWVARGAPWPGVKVSAPRGVSVTSAGELSEESLREARSLWAFQPPQETPPPVLWTHSRAQTPIDQFLFARLERAELEPARPADRRTLIRRATFDLLGLPPESAEVAEFIADQSPDAFARLIDRLLASPRYGERWGRHWLDVARYADSNGMDDNIAWADAWRYRDYVIDAFNQDLPFDQFVREQVAGDLVTSFDDPRRTAAIIATGFLMIGPKMPSADDPLKQQLDIVDEQLDTTGRVFLALTLGCCRCHDHKYDPFPMADYYGLAGMFQSTKTMLSYRVDSKFNLVALEGSQRQHELSRLEAELDRHDDALVNGNSLKMSAEERKEHETGVNGALAALQAIPTAMAVEDGPGIDLPVMLRGNHLTRGPLVPRRLPRVLTEGPQPAMPANSSGRRELAGWLASSRNPLTARVIVNRVWTWHFGQGLVRSSDNFGQLGERPDHPALLDWLTLRFIDSGWSLKELHRLIMNSAVYQIAGTGNEQAALADPENRLLWRFPRQRHSAEVLRDSLLCLSGRLDSTMHGRLLPVANHKIMTTEEVAKCNQAFDLTRRTIYLPVIRSGLADLLSTFDFPDPSISTGRRETTTVAPQALFLLNSPLVAESARAIAEMLLQQPGDEVGRVRRAYEVVLQRTPLDDELQQSLQLLADIERETALAASNSADRRADDSAPRKEAWQALCRVLLSSNEFVYID